MKNFKSKSKIITNAKPQKKVTSNKTKKQEIKYFALDNMGNSYGPIESKEKLLDSIRNNSYDSISTVVIYSVIKSTKYNIKRNTKIELNISKF